MERYYGAPPPGSARGRRGHAGGRGGGLGGLGGLGGRPLRSGLGASPPPPAPLVAAEHAAISALLGEALEAVEDAAQLREKVAAQRRQGQAKREEAEAVATTAARRDAVRLWDQRAELEAQLAEKVRHLHSLESSANEWSFKRTRQCARAKRLHHCLIKATAQAQAQKPGKALAFDAGLSACSPRDKSSTFASLASPMSTQHSARRPYSVANEYPEVHEMKGLTKQYAAKKREVDAELQQAYIDKERIEASIGWSRHAAAVTEALHRARLDAMANGAFPPPPPPIGSFLVSSSDLGLPGVAGSPGLAPSDFGELSEA